MSQIAARKSDKPRRIGARYCSSWCGAGCTWESYQRAVALATDAAKALGPGWTVRVWENMGWHASVVGASISVHVRGGGLEKPAYFALYGRTPEDVGTGHPDLSGAPSFPTARQAVADVIVRAAELHQQSADTLRAALAVAPWFQPGPKLLAAPATKGGA